MLTGTLNVTVADQCFVTCPKNRIKVILHYVEEGWLGKTQNKVQGTVFTYDPNNDNIVRLRDVPDKDILARIEGVWTEKIYYSLGKGDFAKAPVRPSAHADIGGEMLIVNQEKILLADMGPLTVVPKDVPSLDVQLPNESRRFWKDVTAAIKGKQFGHATTLKQEIEEKQRQKAAERKSSEEDWKPRFFTGVVTPVGKPDLTDDGREALDGMNKGDFVLKENDVYAA